MSLFTYRDFCGDEPLAVSSPLGSMENVSSVESLHTVSPREEAPGERAWGAGGSERHRLNDTILSSSSSDEEGDEEGTVTSGHNVEFLLPPPPTFANPPRPPASPSQPGPSGLFSPPQPPPPSVVSPAQTSKLPTRSPQQVQPQALPTQVLPQPQQRLQQVQSQPRPQPQQIPPQPRPQPQQVASQTYPQQGQPQPQPRPQPQQVASQTYPQQGQPQQALRQPRPQQALRQPRPQQAPSQQVPPQPRSHLQQVPPQPRIPGQQTHPRLPGPQTQSRPQQLPSQSRSLQLSPQTAVRRVLQKPTLQQILPRARLQHVSQAHPHQGPSQPPRQAPPQPRPQLPPQQHPQQVPSQPRPQQVSSQSRPQQQQVPSQARPQVPSQARPQQVPSQSRPQVSSQPRSQVPPQARPQQVSSQPQPQVTPQQSLLQTLLQKGPSQARAQQQVSSQMHPQRTLQQPRLPEPQTQSHLPVPQPQSHPQQQVPTQSRLPMPPTVARPPVPPPRPRPSLPPAASSPQPPPPPPPDSPPLMRPPDFVNSLITVSAETLRRVRSAGGGPWQLLPPVPVPLSQQITGCRAVVPLRRLAPVDLHRWLAPTGRGRTLTRRLTEPTGVPGTRTRSNSSEMTDEAQGENCAPLRRPRGRPRGTKSLSPAVIDRALTAVTGQSRDGFEVKTGDPDAKYGVSLTQAMEAQPHAVKNGSSDSVKKLKEKSRSSKVRSRSSDSHHHSRLGLAPAPVVVTLEMAEVAARALVRPGKRHRDDSRERSHSRGSSKRQRTSRSNSGERDHKARSNSGERDHKTTSSSHDDRTHKASRSNSTSDVRRASSPSNEKSKRHEHSSSHEHSTKARIKESSETKVKMNETKTNEVKTKTKKGEVKDVKVKDPIASKERHEKKSKYVIPKVTTGKEAEAEDSKEVKVSKDHKSKKSTSAEAKEKDAKAKESDDKETKAKDAKVKEAERSTKSKGVPLFHPPDRPASSSSGSGEVPHAGKSSSKKSSSSASNERSSTSSAHRRPERHSSADADGSQGRESRSSSPRRSHERHRKRSSDAASSTSGHRNSSASRSTERSSSHVTRPLSSPCKEIGLPEKMPKLSSSSEGVDSGTAVGSEAQGQEASSDNIDSHPNATTTPMPSPERAPTPTSDQSLTQTPVQEQAWTPQSVADLKPTAASVATSESVPTAATTADANQTSATVTSTTISAPKSIAVPVPVSEPATVLASAVSSSMASTLPRVSRWSPAPARTPSVTPAAHVTPVRTPVTAAPDMVTPTSSCESSVAGGSPVTTVTAPTQAVGVDSGSVTTAAPAAACGVGGGPLSAPLMSPVERRAARRAHRRAPPPSAGDAEREAAARRAARRPIVAPGAEPPPPPPPQFPGRPHESSDDEDSLDLSAEIRALQDKYRSSSDEEGEAGGVARESGPSRRRGHAPGGPRPRGRSERCLSASSDEDDGPAAHSGDDELSIFMESDMEWDEAGPSNASQRAGPSAAHDKTRSPFLSSLRPVKQSATAGGAQKLGRPRVGEGWPPQRPGRSPANAGDGWPPKRPGKSPSRGGSSWPPPLLAKEQTSAEGSSNWPPQRLGKPPRRAFGGGGSWPPLKPKREPAAGSDDAWPSLGLTKSADQGSAAEDPPRPGRDSGPEQAEDARRGPSPSPSSRSGPSPGPRAPLERPWNEIPLTPRQYRGPLLPLPGGAPGGAPRPNPRWRAPGVPPLPTRAWPPVRVRSEGPPLPPLELPTPRFDPSPVKSARDTPGPKEEQTAGDAFLDGGWEPPSRQERPASPTAPQPQGPKETAVRPIRRDLELEEGEIAEDSPQAPPPNETDANNNVPLDGSGDGGVSSSSPMKSETLPSDVVELLSGYRHFDEPGYCRPFLQMTPCRCPPEKALNTHVLPPPRVLRVSLRRLRDHGRYASALQLVRAACERSQHEPGPLLDAGCLVRLYAAVVEACVCAGEPGAALLLIPDLRSFGIRNPELFRNIIKDQVPCASLAGPLAGLLSALVAGEIELPPAMWQQLLDLCVHSDAAPAAWAAIGRMVEVGVPPLPRLVERALHVTQTAIPEVLARSGWLVVHNVELLTAVRPSARTMFISQLRRRGMDKLADDIEAQLPRPLLDPVPGRRSPRLSASGSGRWSPRSLTPDRAADSRVPVWDRAADPRTPVRAPVDLAAMETRAAELDRSGPSAERAVDPRASATAPERTVDPRTPIPDRSMAPADRAAAPTQDRTPDPRASAPERAGAAAQDHAAAQTQDRSTAAPAVPRQSMFSLPMPEGALVAIPRHSPLAFAQSQTPLSPQFSPAESDEKTGTDSEAAQSPAIVTRAAPAGEGSSTPPQSPTPEQDSFQYNSPMNIKYEVPSVKASPQLTSASHEASHEEGAEGAEEANPQRPQSDLEGDERRSTHSEPASTRSTPAPKPVRRVPSAELCRPGSVPIQLPTGRQLNFEFEPPSKAATVEFQPRPRSASAPGVEFEPRPMSASAIEFEPRQSTAAAIVFEPPSRSAAAIVFEPPSRAAKAFVFESPPRPARPAAAAAVGAMPVAPGGSEPGRASNAPAWGASNDIPPDQLQLMRVRRRLEQLAAQSGSGAGEVKTEPWRDRAERRRDPRTHSATGANDGMDRTDWRDRVPHHRDPRARADEDRDTKPWRDRDRASQRRDCRSRVATLYNKKKERSWTAEEIAEALAQTEAQARTEAKTEDQAAQARPAVFAWTGEKIAAQADAMAHEVRDEWAELEAKLESESQDDPEAAEVVALVGRLVESLKEAATADDWPAKLYQVLQTMSEDGGRAPILFQRMCAELVAGGSLSHPEQHMLHRLGAALLMTARTDGNWNGAYRVAGGLLSCKISLEAALAAIGPFKGHHPFRLCLAVLEGLMYSGHVNEAYEFADGFGFFPTTSRSQLSVLLPTMCQLHRRLSANGNTAEAYKLLSWMTHRKPRDSKLFGRADYHKLVDQCQLVNGTLLAALRAGITDIALRVHAVAIAQQVQLSPEALRQLLHLRLSSKEHCHVRQLYNTGCNIGVYPQQKVFSPLVVRLPCWMSQEEMLIVLEEYCRAVIAAFGGVPPVQPLTANLVVADNGPPAPLSTPVSDRPEDAAGRLQKACSLVVPALRLQAGGGPLQFVVTAESLADKLMTQAANSRGGVPKAPGLVRVWDAPPGR